MAFCKRGILSFVLLLQNEAGNHTGCCWREGGSGCKDDIGLCERDVRHIAAHVLPPAAAPRLLLLSPLLLPEEPGMARQTGLALLEASRACVSMQPNHTFWLWGVVLTKPAQEPKVVKPPGAAWRSCLSAWHLRAMRDSFGEGCLPEHSLVWWLQ